MVSGAHGIAGHYVLQPVVMVKWPEYVIAIILSLEGVESIVLVANSNIGNVTLETVQVIIFIV